MAKNVTKDMTVGSPMKHIWGFAVPLLFGFLFQQFYSVVDTMIVGQVLGVDALAAVGSTGSINFLIVGFCMGLCNGFAIPVSQKFGAKDYVSMRKYVANSIWAAGSFTILFTVIVSLLCRNMLIWMKTPDNILDAAYSYIFIIFIGIPATVLYNMVSGVIRAMGDSKIPLVFLVISSVLNIFLDLFCMITLKMGVEGAAIATIVSQLVAGVACLLYTIHKFEILHIQKREWAVDWNCIRILCSMGIPMGLQYSITAIGSVILQSSVNTLGSNAVAAVTAANKVGMFMCCPYDALGSTMATYGGQNVGAKKLDRLGKGLKDASILGFIYSALVMVVVWFGGGYLVNIFLGKGGVAIAKDATLFLIIQVAFYFPLALVNIVRFMIQGMGFSTFAIFAGVCEMVARIVVGVFLVPVFGFMGAALASPLAWILADAFLIPAFFHVRGKLQKLFS